MVRRNDLLVFDNKFDLKIVDKLEKLLNDEELILGNSIDNLSTGPGGIDIPVTLGEIVEMNMTNQEPRYFEDL
mgnify:CR=1 FL=1